MEYLVYVMPTDAPGLTLEIVEKETGETLAYSSYSLMESSLREKVKMVVAKVEKKTKGIDSVVTYLLGEAPTIKHAKERDLITTQRDLIKLIELYGGELEKEQKKISEQFVKIYRI
ncbi:MAG: hypothetical protein ABIB43_02690 [archaeon]